MRRTDQRRAAVVALYQRDVTGRPLSELVEPQATPFTRELVEGTDSEIEELDALIARYAEGDAGATAPGQGSLPGPSPPTRPSSRSPCSRGSTPTWPA